jgi:hypothetical protein
MSLLASSLYARTSSTLARTAPNWVQLFNPQTRRAATRSNLDPLEVEDLPHHPTGDDVLLPEAAPDSLTLMEAVFKDLVESSEHDRVALTRWIEAVPSAARFSDGIADLVGLPEIDIDPDGDVALDWFLPRDNRLAVSINPSGGAVFVLLFHDGTSTKMDLPSVSQAIATVRRALDSSATAKR